MIGAVVARAFAEGQRLLIVSDDAAQRETLDRALWEYRPEAFLAHGFADQPGAERQPVLISDRCDPANGARTIAFADGNWRDEAETFDRALLFFDESAREAARAAWRKFDQREDAEREFHDLDKPKE